jgi:putative PIN family toxin of toxin-antitoxin system
MKVVLDTIIFLVSISRKSPFHWIFEALLSGRFTLCLTNEIISEYEEIIAFHMGKELADATLKLLIELENVEKVNIYFRWNLIKDADDNKFSDCALACWANYLVTHDADLNVLKKLGFPKVPIITAAEFELALNSGADITGL